LQQLLEKETSDKEFTRNMLQVAENKLESATDSLNKLKQELKSKSIEVQE